MERFNIVGNLNGTNKNQYKSVIKTDGDFYTTVDIQ